MKSLVLRTGILSLAVCLFVSRVQAQPCVGDCNRGGEVTVDELVAGVIIALGGAPLEQCPASDCNGNGQVTVDCLVRAVGVALNGCVIGVCGNGAVEYVEECDDGNANPRDGCTDVCTICGNRIVTPPEACDDGNLVDGDGCDGNCRLTACGNGIVTAGEQCDDGNVFPCDGCTPTCQIQRCGDGVLDADCEQCDDGNTSNADGCTAGCRISYCGDGFLNPAAEECDDSGNASCDGCSAACQSEIGVCGDGVLDGNCEQCDDGNTSDTDACRNDCTAGDVPGRVGPGSISALVIDPHNPATLYARTACGGVLKSSDGGETWTAAANGLPGPESPSFAAGGGPLAIDPIMPSTLYAGGYPGSAVFKSTNGAGSWSAASSGLPVPFFFCSGSGCAGNLAVDPVTPSTLYAAGVGFEGIFKSTDRGDTWRAANAGLPQPAYVSAFAVDPTSPERLYAGVSGSAFRSTNGGNTWRAANTGLPQPGGAPTAFAIDPATPGTLYTSVGGPVFKSTDGGSTWRAAYAGLPDPGYSALAIDPTTPDTLYAGTRGGVFKSTDGGDTWRRANTGMPPVAALAIDPTLPSTLYAASNKDTLYNESAVYKSTDGGATWQATGLAGAPRCGDGVQCGGSEACDDGNAVDGDGCDSNCTATGCNNRILTAGEECDDGNGQPCDGCTADCLIETGRCGDAVLNTACETCDDGNTSNADACRSDCRPNVCGDGFVNPGVEGCDDGNQISGDGCDRDCTPTACGNGIVTAGEECDDGNTNPCDGCTPTCKIRRCGDGHLDADCGEQCDDGNANPFDGCTDACTRCGDGIVTPPEQCEDGNGCTSACTTCGDGVVTPPEQCDDGNLSDGDGCEASCTTTGCGNAVVQGDEECDDGNTIGGDGCAANCTREHLHRFGLVAESPIGVQTKGLLIPLGLSGELTVRTGRPRGGNADVPLVIRTTDLHVDPIEVSGLLCLCLGAVADPAVGLGNAGSGTIACGDAGLSNVDVATSIDHDTDDTDSACAHGAIEAGRCVYSIGDGGIGICEGEASDGRSCRGDFDCAPHPVCNGPEMTTFSGSGPSGSAVIEVRLASWAFRDCSTDPDDPRKGPDGVPCTDDDSSPRSTVGRCGGYVGCYSLLPPHIQLRLTTGTARAEIIDANDVPGELIAAGATCGGNTCMTEVAGRPFDCSLLRQGLRGASSAEGAALAGAFSTLDNVTLGDTVTTLVLGLGAPLPDPCVGDCDQSGTVTVAELVTGVNGALSNAIPDDCPSFDANGDGRVTVDELIATVDAALNGCEQ